MTSTTTLHLGDCLDVMRGMADASVDMTMTSPPYDDLRDYGDGFGGFGPDVWKPIMAELFRITRLGGVVVWIVADATKNGSETGTSFRQALWAMDCGFNLHDTMIWEKDTFSFPCPTRYRGVSEYMFVFSRGKISAPNLIADRQNKYAGCQIHGTSRGTDGNIFRKSNDKRGVVAATGVRYNVWRIACEKNNASGHPAPFPVALASDHIKSWSNPGAVVLDPFMGSGTTGVACKNLDRNFIGIELDPRYFEIAKARIGVGAYEGEVEF